MTMHPITRQWEAIGIGLWAGDCVIALDRVFGGRELEERDRENLKAAVDAATTASDVSTWVMKALGTHDPRIPSLARMNLDVETALAIKEICERALAGGAVSEDDLETVSEPFTQLQHRCMVVGRGERPLPLL